MIIMLFMFSILGSISWWQISGPSRQNFESICKNYIYEDCMKFFWDNFGYYRNFLYLSLIGGILALGGLIVMKRKRGKNKESKHQKRRYLPSGKVSVFQGLK